MDMKSRMGVKSLSTCGSISIPSDGSASACASMSGCGGGTLSDLAHEELQVLAWLVCQYVIPLEMQYISVPNDHSNKHNENVKLKNHIEYE